MVLDRSLVMSLVEAGFPVKISSDLSKYEPDLIAQGAEALTFIVEGHNDFEETKVVAKYRPPKPYRIPELDLPLRKRRTNAEVRVLRKLTEAQVDVPKVLAVYDDQGLIYMEYINGKSLKQVAWDAVAGSDVYDFFHRFGELVAEIHALRIVHGDLTTSNAMVDNAGVLKLIDFGLASQAASVEDKAVDIYVLERAIASTHPNFANQFIDRVLEGYESKATSLPGVQYQQVMARLRQVRQRGRKRTMLG